MIQHQTGACFRDKVNNTSWTEDPYKYTHDAKACQSWLSRLWRVLLPRRRLLLPLEGGEVDVVLEDSLPFLKIRHDVVLV